MRFAIFGTSLLGALYPQSESKGGELITMQKYAQGLTSYRERAGQAESDPTIRKVFAMNLEKVNANLDGMCASSRQMPRRLTGGVKSVIPPSEQVSACDTPRCGKIL